jgi:prevent-host-death family protein
MPRRADDLDLDVDLKGGVVPISKAASSLAALIKRSRERRQPIIVTQKGYPTGVLLPVELFTALRKLAGRAAGPGADGAELPPQPAEAAPAPKLAQTEPEIAPPATAVPLTPQRQAKSGRRAKALLEQGA